ncbi:DUF2750 domain-containing protein [Balneatrix alpica]|uniref:DUF2750 domain-containing protein n=1 Tax=Balneatrix alpica TaxID=75684 RepID=A0ABV5Z704_9GAMM|nr:DUF2750 domain-containing protein [Balneatrix alpica]
MPYQLSSAQLQKIRNLPAVDRYDYFLRKVIDWEQIWSLKSAEGWVAMSADGLDCIPVWPHPDFAKEWATDDWADCQPEAVSLDVWLERWTPGLTQDNTYVAIFPNGDDEEVVMSAEELEEALELESGEELGDEE